MQAEGQQHAHARTKCLGRIASTIHAGSTAQETLGAAAIPANVKSFLRKAVTSDRIGDADVRACAAGSVALPLEGWHVLGQLSLVPRVFSGRRNSWLATESGWSELQGRTVQVFGLPIRGR